MPFSRKVVGGSMQPNLVIDALEIACSPRSQKRDLRHPSWYNFKRSETSEGCRLRLQG